MKPPALQQHAFYGSTTLGVRGQVVIPAEARTKFGIKEGDKLLVFGMGNGMIAFAKPEHMLKFEKHLADHLKSIRKAVRFTK